jgi:hypothetical protein
VSLYRRNLNSAGLLFLSTLRHIIWSLTWLPQCKVGGRSGFISKIRKILPLTITALLPLMLIKI